MRWPARGFCETEQSNKAQSNLTGRSPAFNFRILASGTFMLYTRYPIVARALGLAAAKDECAREQRYLAYNFL